MAKPNPEVDNGPILPQPGAKLMARRFRGFLPVVIDVETGGFHNTTDALLEVAAVIVDMDENGVLKRGATHSFHVIPFEGSRLDPASLAVTGIDPFHPLRPAIPEKDALQRIFREVRHAVRAYTCRRAILVGHNAAFDLGFLNAAVTRSGDQAQSLSSVLVLRHGVTGRRGARTDRAGESDDGRRIPVGFELSALRVLRRRTHGRHLLPHLESADEHVQGSRDTRLRARLA